METLQQYDAGYLPAPGGAPDDWWQDVIRVLLAEAHDFYASQFAERLPSTEWQVFRPSHENPVRQGDQWRPRDYPNMPWEDVEDSIGMTSSEGLVLFRRQE